MVSKGLLVRLEVKSDKESDAEEFLRSALPLVRQETGTVAWFALRFGRQEYGIFDVFADEAGRDAHLNGAVAKALFARAEELLAAPPRIQKLDVLADKLPAATPGEPDTKGLLLTFRAHSGHEGAVEEFLRNAKAFVDQEPDTTAWFAIHLEDGHYGIFDVFPDHLGRLKHLTGRVAQELTKHAVTLLGSLPDPDLPNVLAESFAG